MPRYTAPPQEAAVAVQSPGLNLRPSEIEDLQVPQKVYLNYIKNQLSDEAACLELPFTLLILVSFSMLAVMHLRQDVVFSVEQAIERDIVENANFAFSHAFGHKGIFDVWSIADFWSWVRLGFIPLVIQPSWSYSENYMQDKLLHFNTQTTPNQRYILNGAGEKAVPIIGDYLRYQRIVGGLRFRQETVETSEDKCKLPYHVYVSREIWAQWYGKPCMPATTELAFDPDTTDSEDFGTPRRVEWMFTDLDSYDDMVAHVVDMEDGCSLLVAKNRSNCLCKWCQEQEPTSPWLTEQTQRVQISMATYNAEYGLISLTGVDFFFSRGGFIHKRVEIMSSWLDPYSRPLDELLPMLICDFVWLGSLLYIIVGELKEVVHVIRTSDKWYLALYYDYFAFWNAVDWTSILIALIVVISFATLFLETGNLQNNFTALIELQTDTGVDHDTYVAQVMDFYNSLDAVVQQEKVFRISLCIYPMVVMLRLFKSFAAQPRLAMVTETMKEAYQDLLHFSLVFIGVTVCLCMNAVLLFGQKLNEFATFSRAMHSCFRMMFGDWDWERMEGVHRWAAMIWFWLFMLLSVIILLNMLLAIVMDNYMHVKQRSSGAITLGGQMGHMWRRYRQSQRKERVRLQDIQAWFLNDAGGDEKAMTISNRNITPAFLVDNVPGMPLSQALRTLTHSIEEDKRFNSEPWMLEHAQDPLVAISDNTDLIHKGLRYALDRVDYYDTEEQEQEVGTLEQDQQTVAERQAHAVAHEQAASGGVHDFVQGQVDQLRIEVTTATHTSFTILQRRQDNVEQRQSDMSASISDMQTSLERLLSRAVSLEQRLRLLVTQKHQSAYRGTSAWRLGLGPSCMTMMQAARQTIPGSATSLGLKRPQ